MRIRPHDEEDDILRILITPEEHAHIMAMSAVGIWLTQVVTERVREIHEDSGRRIMPVAAVTHNPYADLKDTDPPPN